MSLALTIGDLEKQARRRVPKMFFDYVDSGSWTESTYRANEAAFDKIKLRQRVLVDMSNRSLKSTMVGQPVSMPVAIGPTGFAGMQYANGEMLAVVAAEQFGIPYTLSTMGICSIEDVASVATKPFWFQLYVMRDRAFVKNLIDRAKAAKCSALVLTLDLQIVGQRHKDIRNNLSAPPKITVKTIAEMMRHPKWCMHMMMTRRHTFRNIVGHAKNVSDLGSLSSWTEQEFDPRLSWKDVEWVKKLWGGPLIIKGILDAEDALMALNSGADAIVVSNHGGRQLDGAPASIDVLPEIIDVIDGRMEVLFDSGIRSGQDVLKAVALGAKGCFIGRAYLYGLGADGGKGVTRALQIIEKELSTTMAFCGKRDILDVTRDILYDYRPHFEKGATLSASKAEAKASAKIAPKKSKAKS